MARPQSALPPTLQPATTSQVPSAGLHETEPRTPVKTNGPAIPADAERDSVVWLHQRIMTLQARARVPLAENPQTLARRLLIGRPC